MNRRTRTNGTSTGAGVDDLTLRLENIGVTKSTATVRADALAYLTRKGHHDIAPMLGLTFEPSRKDNP